MTICSVAEEITCAKLRRCTSPKPLQGSAALLPDFHSVRATDCLLLFLYIPLRFVLTLFFPFQLNASFLHYSDSPGTVLVWSRYVATSQPEPASTPGADVLVKLSAPTHLVSKHSWAEHSQGEVKVPFAAQAVDPSHSSTPP